MSRSIPSASVSPLGRFASIPLFLALVAGLPAGAVALRRAGAQQEAVAFLVLVAAGAALAWIERCAPYAPAWNPARGDVRLDAVHTAVSIAVGALVPALVTSALVHAGADGQASVLWPRAWPLTAQVLVALALADLGKYALHRWSHESTGFLWRVHAVHHDAERLYWLNAGRFHPLNVAFNVTLAVLPLRLLGVPAEVAYAASLVSAVHNFTSHANIDLRLGPLNWVFSAVELHRWHHAQRVEDANHNYGGTLILWDVIFGTRWLPDTRLGAHEVGLEGGESLGGTWRAHLYHPFRSDTQTSSGAHLTKRLSRTS